MTIKNVKENGNFVNNVYAKKIRICIYFLRGGGSGEGG